MQSAPRLHTQYYYPGGQISGPVLIPGTRFNHNRDKLFFFVAYEYYWQAVDNGIYRAFVPTAAMRNGDFSALTSYLGGTSPGGDVQNMPNSTVAPGGVVPVVSM